MNRHTAPILVRLGFGPLALTACQSATASDRLAMERGAMRWGAVARGGTLSAQRAAAAALVETYSATLKELEAAAELARG